MPRGSATQHRLGKNADLRAAQAFFVFDEQDVRHGKQMNSGEGIQMKSGRAFAMVVHEFRIRLLPS